jgi:hypothetical protein
MYFETGQGSALSAEAHHGVDQLTLEARAYGVARGFDPFLVNSVVGFIGPEYLYDERQIIRAGLEDHFMGKLLGLPMGCDVCYTNHADADQNSADNLLVLLAAAGCNYFMGVPCSDDVMLNYQSTSYHDALAEWSVGEIYVIRHCRVGILNEIGELLAPKVVALLIGERPGLATAESLSTYMAYRPKASDTDADRNLISNIHARGVTTEQAAQRILNLAAAMMRNNKSGCQLREELPEIPGLRRK